MTTVFPGAIDSFPRPSGSTKTNATGFKLSEQIDNHADAIEAVETVLSGAGGPNVILDPGLNLWPDGTSFTSIADGTWGPTGLIYRKSGAVVHDLLRSTDVPAVSSSNPLTNYSCHLDVTTADAALAIGDFAALAARIEGYDWQKFAQRQFSFGFWVKAAKTGVHCVYARNSGNDRSCVIEYIVNAPDTWEYKTVTFPASPSAGTWNYTNGRGIEIGWTQYAGTTFQTTAGAWQTGNFYATANQVNEVDSTANNFRIAMIGPPTVGPYAAPFTALPIALEELRSYRYYVKLTAAGAGPIFGFGQAYATTAAVIGVDIPVPLRAVPSLSHGGVANFFLSTAGFANNGLAGATFSLYNAQVGQAKHDIQITGADAGLTAGAATFLYAVNASAQLTFNARLS